MSYAFNPHRAPDSDFDPGTLEHLVPGNSGRMLDTRRTPIRVAALMPGVGMFACEVLEFEDRGATWELVLESVSSFQFAKGCARAAPGAVREMERAVTRFGRPLVIECDPASRERTRERLGVLAREASRWIESNSRFVRAGASADFGSLEGDPRLWEDVREYLGACGVGALEEAFARGYVSNPRSGEIVKAHRVVLAELGLAPYRDLVLRDPASLEGAWDRSARETHLLHRMAFVRALFAHLRLPEVRLFRGGAGERGDPSRRDPGFLSATFSREVAEAVLGPPDAPRAGRVEERLVSADRLFMTYLETEAMNRPFREAEAVLVVGDGEPLFGI